MEMLNIIAYILLRGRISDFTDPKDPGVFDIIITGICLLVCLFFFIAGKFGGKNEK